MKKINWKILNLVLWGQVIISFFLPFKNIDNFEYQIGAPIPYLSIYAAELGIAPINSIYINPFSFILNGLIAYYLIILLIKLCKETKVKKEN
ncbi:hypothetical protein AN641_06180 [Candidatus Epulonipiscioides gigas]|nr:hypothetical protein AN641_06180 [Epulopiscium sp. SCG-C07WGA-EpuloA2]